ncbi:MAG: hypothetical protein LUD03_01960, partial [Firmicutes bacterium]|nr:hypothetical protein [Bacillota bacterium]
MKKRIIAALTAAALALAPLGAFAADTSETEAALTAVKGKIDIPESYTEFSVNYYDNSDDVSYYFTWSNTDSTESLAVEADAEGRITYYSLDSNNDYYSDDVNLAQYSAADVREFAKTKLERIMPEAFGADDTLVVSSSIYSSGRNRYNVVFKREKSGEEVLYDYVGVVLGVDADGALYVKYVNISYNYDAEFETPTDEIADLNAAYQAVSPAELQYYIKYSYENGKTVKTADLHYVSRHKYMSVYSGEPIDVYYSDEVYADASASAEAGGSGNTLSDAEIAKLEEIGGL